MVNRVQFAAGKIQPVIKRRRALGLVAATLVAAVLAASGFGWALAERNNVETLKSIVHQRNVRISDLFRLTKSLTEQVKGSTTMLASLTPAPDGHGQGQVLIYSAPGQADFVGVNAALPTGPAGQPYTVQLVTHAGVINIGTLKRTDTPGEWQLLQDTTQNLRGVVSVTIIDGASQTLLTGTFPTASSA